MPPGRGDTPGTLHVQLRTIPQQDSLDTNATWKLVNSVSWEQLVKRLSSGKLDAIRLKARRAQPAVPTREALLRPGEKTQRPMRLRDKSVKPSAVAATDSNEPDAPGQTQVLALQHQQIGHHSTLAERYAHSRCAHLPLQGSASENYTCAGGTHRRPP